MLENRLRILLAERRLKVKQVVEDTGISRSAISNISNNPKANIATKNIDTLCQYFDVTPAEFFEYEKDGE
jgi:putative transcriptional regulator